MRLVRYYPNYRALGGVTRSPWAGLEGEIDRLFTTALADYGGIAAGRRFAVDLYEDKDNAYVRAELPGVNREDINVEALDGTLTITAARKTPATEGQAEQSFSFSRSVTLPEQVQADQIVAAYENGVLTVPLPTRADAPPPKLTVAVN